jgi:CHAT domain-containing protein/tetratricopeptide (TPR) repeat protein
MSGCRANGWLLAAALGLPLSVDAADFALPPSCATVAQPPDAKTPIRELRKRVEAENEIDPNAAFGILCTTIPRVAAQYGEQSAEFAWWFASLATPLIAYMDKYDEALPILQYVQPILERNYGRYGVPLGDIHVAYAWIYFRQGQLAESGAAWTNALKVRERSPGKKKIELQKVLVGLAQVELAQREFTLAENHLKRAHDIAVENHDTVSEAGAAIESALINVAFRQERFEDARRHAEETLRIENRLSGGAPQLVPAYALLGRILERLDEFEQAETALRHAVDLAQGMQGPLQRHQFSALYQLAALLEDRGRAAEAREQAELALKVGESTLGPMAPRLVPVLQVLGDAQHQLGQLPEALRQFERADAIIAANKTNVERPWLVDYYRDLGALQMSLGDPVAAEHTLAAGLDAAGEDPTLAVERAWLLLEHSRAAGQIGSRDISELLRAVALLRSKLPESHPAILRVLNELCEIEVATPDAAPNCSETAKRIEQSQETAPDLRATIYDNESRLASARSDYASARHFAVRAVAAAESAATPEPMWQAYFRLATVLRRDGDSSLAVFLGKQALTQIETERSHFVGQDRRFEVGFLRDKVAAYRNVADWLLELGRVDEGLAVLQLMKSEELTDFGVRAAALTPDPAGLFTDAETALNNRYSPAVQPDNARKSELSRLSGLQEAGKISPAERNRLEAMLAGKGEAEQVRAARIEQLLQGAADNVWPDGGRQSTIAVSTLARTARRFGTDTAFAVYLLTEHHLRILVTARDEQAEFTIPIDGPQLKRDIGYFLSEIAQRRDVSALSAKLYNVIARPVDEFAAQHRVHRLTLWLDDSLRYVPIAALQDGHRYLLDKYIIQIYSPALDAEPSHAAMFQVRGLGVTQAIGGFAALPAVADELCYVVRGPIEGLQSSSSACATPSSGHGALQGKGFADAAFTEQRFKELLDGPRDFSVLHVGTHFRLRPGNALRSFLLLGDGSVLTLDAMSALDFHAIDLVTLSACETGMGGAHTDDGREIEGLSALVQRRGAGRVIASLWQVEDASTAQLMRGLYAEFSATHGDAALGLQRAQRALRSLSGSNGTSYSNPYYWAGFSVAGSRP